MFHTTSALLVPILNGAKANLHFANLLFLFQQSVQQWAVQQQQHGNTLHGSECSICYERPIDSVLYMCGHMCMCFECAVQQWRGKGGGHCPMCRAVIRDVIRTYKS